MKKRIIIMSGIIVFMLVAYIGFSYALFTKSEKQEGINEITTYNCLDISINGEEELNLNNAYPIKDEEGVLQTPYTFTITNNCNKYVSVDVGIELQDNNTLSDEKLKVSLNKKYEEPNGTILSSHRTYYTENEQQVLDTKYILFHDGINANNEANYEYRMWIDYNAGDEIVGSIFKGKVIATATIRTEEPHGWSNSESGMLLYALKRDNMVTEPLTVIGDERIRENESVLASAEDDYGTSYYFRGNVENNYLVFANKCWRIVRVTGDGSIKLILHNNDSINCNISDYTLNFAKYDGENNTSKFSKYSNNPIAIGFMYGDINATDYYNGHQNIYDNEILLNLKHWYDLDSTFTNREKNMLADTIWCNDKSLGSGDGISMEIANVFGASYRRTNFNLISLICPSIENYEKLSKFTAHDIIYGNGMLKGYKIGLITSDEAMFSGIYRNPTEADKVKPYLYNNNPWWTMSPMGSSNNKLVYAYDIIDGHLNTGNAYLSNASRGLRPMVALISNIKITNTNQNGTISNPYVIDET